MKNEINGKESIYYISMFCMPIITFIGVALLLNVIIEISNTIVVTKYDISNVFFKEIALYIGCWVLLFSSYIFYKINCKVAQIGIVTLSIGLLIYAIFTAINTITSLANIVNPIIVGSAALYGLLKPMTATTDKKGEQSSKETTSKVTQTRKKNNKKSKSNK